MSVATTANLARFYADLSMKLAMEPKNIIMRGLKTAVERNVDGADVNAAAANWVTAGWLAQADADEIAALVTARDAPPVEPEEEPEEPEE